jgi:hypothetical protein
VPNSWRRRSRELPPHCWSSPQLISQSRGADGGPRGLPGTGTGGTVRPPAAPGRHPKVPTGWNIAGRRSLIQGATGRPGRCQAIRPNCRARAAASVRLAAPAWPRTCVRCFSLCPATQTVRGRSAGLACPQQSAAASWPSQAARASARSAPISMTLPVRPGPDRPHSTGPLPLGVPQAHAQYCFLSASWPCWRASSASRSAARARSSRTECRSAPASWVTGVQGLRSARPSTVASR